MLGRGVVRYRQRDRLGRVDILKGGATLAWHKEWRKV